MSAVDEKVAEVLAEANGQERPPTQAELDQLLKSIDDESGVVARSNRIAADLVPFLARWDESAREAMIADLASRFKWASRASLRRDSSKAHAEIEASKPVKLRPADPDLVPGQYFSRDGRLWWVATGRDGPRPVPLTNFEGRIKEQVFGDDGSEDPIITFHVEGRLYDGRNLPTLVVPNRQFDSMSWVNDWGGEPTVFAGPGIRDHARVAIKSCSTFPLPTRHKYQHTGWRNVGGRWVYLHAGGAIDATGSVSDVEVELWGAFRRYELPDPPTGTELANAVRASLRMLLVAPLTVTAPVYAAMARAPLGHTDFSLFLAGDSGLGKTELASLAQRHWGSSMERTNLPGNWQSTANNLEVSAFTPKDALFVVDDFAPTGGRYDYDKWVKDADRFFRAVGNQAGRGRLRSDGLPQATKYPRCLPLSTGEDIPNGLSSMASRVFWVEMSKGNMQWDTLSESQSHARAGLYASAMSGYVCWLAQHHDEIFNGLEEARNGIARDIADASTHKRTPRIVADLMLGLSTWLQYAVEVKAIDQDTSDSVYELCTQALVEIAGLQSKQQSTRAPARRFLDLIRAAITAGRAHIRDDKGRAPSGLESACGWQQKGGSYSTPPDWVSQGACIGWKEDGWIWLHRDTSYAVAQEQGRGQNDSIAVSVQTLAKRLNESGFLAYTDQARGTLHVRRTFEGGQQTVYCIEAKSLLGEISDTTFDQPENPGSADQNLTKLTSTCQGDSLNILYTLLPICQFCQKIPQIDPSRNAGAGPCHARDHAPAHASCVMFAGEPDKTDKSSVTVGNDSENPCQVSKTKPDKSGESTKENADLSNISKQSDKTDMEIEDDLPPVFDEVEDDLP